MEIRIRNLYDACTGGSLDRRAFLTKLSAIAGGTAAAVLLLEDLEARADVVSRDDPRLVVEDIKYPGATGDVLAHQARPKGEGKWPGVIVIHENRGLNAHIRDVARRFALEGYLVVAPDALSPLGGTPEDPEKVRGMFGELDGDATVKNFAAAVQYLKTHPKSTVKVGCTGFCWGGGMTNSVAVSAPDLVAAVPFYGRQPAAVDVPKIKASMLIHYAGNDERINAGIPAFEEALKKAKIEYKIYMYEGAAHAFFNDTNESRYNAEAAGLAWKRTLAFFREKLKT